MSLVPIIYTSLLIFSAFLLFVIIVSYISFKTKTRDRVPFHLKNYDPLGNRLAVQPLAVNNYNIVRHTAAQYVIPIQSNKHSQKLERLQKEEDNYLRSVQALKKKTYEAKIFSDTDKKGENEIGRNKESYQLTRSYKPIPLLNRLEIMNQSEKFKTSVREESYSIKKEKSYTNHGDINLFSFYSDRSDLDSAAFSTPKINRAI